MRTSTAVLIVAFVVVLGIYLALRPDPTTDENSPVYSPPPTTTTAPAGIPIPGLPGITIPVPTPPPTVPPLTNQPTSVPR